MDNEWEKESEYVLFEVFYIRFETIVENERKSNDMKEKKKSTNIARYLFRHPFWLYVHSYKLPFFL